MNKITLSKIFIFFVLIFSFSVTNADFKDSKVSSDNVEFSWEPIENVFIYKILYWLDSSTNIAYDKESDYIENNSYILYDLVAETKYYFTLVWYDEMGKEIYKSSEISISTKSKSETINYDSLFIEDAIQVSKNKVELMFSNEISDLTNYEREFKIENVKNSNEIFEVIETSISIKDKKNLLITLDKEPIIGQEYKIIVLNIRDIYEQNIEFWVNSEATFKWVEITEEQEQELESDFTKDYVSLSPDNTNSNGNWSNSNNWNTLVITNVEDDKIVEENPVNWEDIIKNETEINTIESWNLAWIELNSADVLNNVLAEADDTSKLPATWPEQAIFLIIALILTWVLFAYKFRKI